MNLNPENVAKFKDVAKFFAEDIAKQEAAQVEAPKGPVPPPA